MKKYKLFGKIPVFDIILVAVVLIAGIVLYSVLTSGNSANVVGGTETKTIRYTVKFLNISNMVEGEAESGEKVYDTVTNYEIGTVVSSYIEPFINYSYNEVTGEGTSTKYDDRKIIYVVVEAKASISAKYTQINNVKIGLGKIMTISMPSLCATGVIVDIEEA